MEYTIGKKKFKIEKVSIYISELYGELTTLAYGYSDLSDELEEITLQYDIEKEEAETRADRKRAELKKVRAIRELKQKSAEITKEIFDKRFVVLKEALELNGYDFDRDFWHKNASTEEVNDILVNLLTGSKKKVAANST